MTELVVIEPWDFGSLNGVGPFNVTLKKGIKGNYLVIFDKEIKFKNKSGVFLLGKAGEQFGNIDLINREYKKVILALALIDDLNTENFKKFDLDNFRGEFLTGELSNTFIYK